MAVTSSGQISLAQLHNEIVLNNYDSLKTGDDISLADKSGANSPTLINTYNDSSDRPDSTAPHSMSEFYSYDHDKASPDPPYPVHMAEDFAGDVSTWDATGRDTFATTGWADGSENSNNTYPHPNDGCTEVNSATVSKRPVHSDHSGNVYDSGNDQAYFNQGGPTDWHNSIYFSNREHDDVDFDTGELAIGECFNVQLKWYHGSGGNKDFFVFMVADSSQQSTQGTGNQIRFQFRDNSDSTYARKQTITSLYNDTATVLAASTNQFSTNTWYISTCSYKVIGSGPTTEKRIYTTTAASWDGGPGTQWVTSTSGANYARFYGLCLLHVRSGNSSAKHYVDWLRCWTSNDWPS